MKVVAVMPMKLNNRRLPNKNLKCFTNGKPLFTYALSTLLQTNGVDDIFVFCSNEQIKDMLPKGVSFLRRDICLDQDTTSMNEVLSAFASKVSADIYILVHATAPFITRESIEDAVRAIKNDGYDSAFSVVKLQDFIWKDGKPFNYSLKRIPRTQDLPALYKETSGFYAFKRNVLIDGNRRIGDKPFMVEVGEIEAIDIDEAEDFAIADAIQFYRNHHNNEK